MNKKLILIFVVSFLVLTSFVISITSIEEDYVKSLIEKQGITKIDNITELDKSVLPSQIDISMVDENNVGIYEVGYEDSGILKNLFVISYSSSEIIPTKKEVGGNFLYLPFTIQNGVSNSYVMMDSGSIVGISSLSELKSGEEIIIRVYKNDEPLYFYNELSSQNLIDFDLESPNLDLFNVGDKISIRVETNGGDFSYEAFTNIKVVIQ
ncbi:hypothetical protein GW932_03700 [archaeon]|nr:hypothetical protein [archaeon]